MLSTLVVRHVKLSNRIVGFVLLFKIFGTAVFTNIKIPDQSQQFKSRVDFLNLLKVNNRDKT